MFNLKIITKIKRIYLTAENANYLPVLTFINTDNVCDKLVNLERQILMLNKRPIDCIANVANHSTNGEIFQISRH